MLSSQIATRLNGIAAATDTTDLGAMNNGADVDKQDPAVLASTWLKSHSFTR